MRKAATDGDPNVLATAHWLVSQENPDVPDGSTHETPLETPQKERSELPSAGCRTTYRQSKQRKTHAQAVVDPERH
jgi:hypothetical protein